MARQLELRENEAFANALRGAGGMVHNPPIRSKIGAMAFRADVKQRIEDELARGEAARREGLEGRARVCARRAAGAAVRAYLEARGLLDPRLTSAYDLIAYLRDLPGTGAEVRQVAERLLTQVNPSFDLPLEADLLADAHWLAQTLESEMDGYNTDSQERER